MTQPKTALRERRIVSLDRIQFRAADPEAKTAPVFAGHAAVFNSRTEIWPGFIEIVKPGTFAKSLKADDIRGLFNHNPDYILGRNTAKTMRLEEDESGLAFEIDAPDTTVARDLGTSIARGDISQCSFSFSTIAEEVRYEGDTIIRTLTEVKLYDVGPVTFPAYPETDIGMRSLEVIAAECKQTLEKASRRGVPVSIRRRIADEIGAGIR